MTIITKVYIDVNSCMPMIIHFKFIIKRIPFLRLQELVNSIKVEGAYWFQGYYTYK